jgi:hypothetical protein
MRAQTPLLGLVAGACAFVSFLEAHAPLWIVAVALAGAFALSLLGDALANSAFPSHDSKPQACATPRKDSEMTKMNQEGTDRGEKGETGEREPKGATASDTSGERKMAMKNGVGMGEKDATGRSGDGKHEGHVGQFNTGRGSSTEHFYKHGKDEYKGKKGY